MRVVTCISVLSLAGMICTGQAHAEELTSQETYDLDVKCGYYFSEFYKHQVSQPGKTEEEIASLKAEAATVRDRYSGNAIAQLFAQGMSRGDAIEKVLGDIYYKAYKKYGLSGLSDDAFAAAAKDIAAECNSDQLQRFGPLV